MIGAKRILLINPTITSRRSARFPLAVLNLSASLDGSYVSSIIDGNIDRDFVSTALRTVETGSVDAVGVSVMGGPQLRSAIAVSRALRADFRACPSSGAVIFRQYVRRRASMNRMSTTRSGARERIPFANCSQC